MSELIDKARQFLFARQYAYKKTFEGPLADNVLRDLAKFCRANASAFDADPRIHAGFEGRREVWLRIQQHLQLSPQELWRLTDGRED